MCIVALACGQHPRLPLVIAANRDEYHARPALPAMPWSEDAAVAGGRDLQAGGAWLAAHRDGRFAVVTNVRQAVAARGSRSRGEPVREFVTGSVAVGDFLATLAGHCRDYAPFNLVVGDAHGAWWLDGVNATHGRFEPGTHAFSNGPVHAAWPKCRGVAAALEQALRVEAPAVDALMAALGDTSPAADAELPDTGVGIAMERFLSPIHIVGETYGTRASSVLALAVDGRHRLLERRFGPNGAFAGESAWCAEGRGWVSGAWPGTL
jgi:uncharacterized protein with NRDE domain